jgi:hypothetical protein
LQTQDIDHYSSVLGRGSFLIKEKVVQSMRLLASVKIRVLCTVTASQQDTE